MFDVKHQEKLDHTEGAPRWLVSIPAFAAVVAVVAYVVMLSLPLLRSFGQG
ncbi:hypothetical protein AB3X96_29750 [Paraburkholderia sp. BR13439]|uniref:hypothetical protein n=1 Tax=Paraburkholderia TaxID=1822464 RepID=UPI0034CE6813